MSLTIRQSLFIGYLGGIFLSLIIGATALYDRYLLTQGMEEAQELAGRIEASYTLDIAVERLLTSPSDYLITGDPEVREGFLHRKAEVEGALKRLREIAGRPGRNRVKEALSLLTELEREYQVLLGKVEAILSIKDPVNNTEGRQLMMEVKRIGKRMGQIMDEYRAFDRGELEKVMDHQRLILRRVDISIAVATFLFFLFALFYIIYLERSIRRPIEDLVQGVKEVHPGRWSRLSIRGVKEFALLAEEFNRMIGKLEEAYSELERKVDERTRELKETNAKLERELSEVRRLQRLTEELAIRDGLTGLFNYRYFWQRLEQEVSRAKRFSHPLSVIMADIDHFKDYNDLHGHLKGDNLLKEIALFLKNSVRAIDVVARYGGEEFTIILVQTGKEDALKVAEKLRKGIEREDFPHQETQPGGRITMSFGVASYPVDATDPEGLVREADRALYRAKEEGRNRTIAA